MYVNTYSGKKVRFDKVLRSQINIQDIAKSLSRIARYCGHTKEFYSVAQHSVLVSDQVYRLTGNPRLALQGLLHETPECYGMSDIHGSFKRMLGKQAKKVIKGYESKIFKALGFKEELDEIVDYVDCMLLVDEMGQLLENKSSGVDFKDNKKYGDCKGFGLVIKPYSSEIAEKEFLRTYHYLTGVTNV
jgi:hypothetical protein